ncbi:TIGR02186 family protein [uncultured Hyphomicrobium sp.]|uniref:TIGR02186 family protein n=1 Tax=uncultured Hyphomicrobium sp. TaxID=194373 RepID=UPI0025FE086D|nr:TIGR02186 family protein [uncultured Hyphomicrobium sp.]
MTAPSGSWWRSFVVLPALALAICFLEPAAPGRAQTPKQPEAELPDWGKSLRKQDSRNRKADPRAAAPTPAKRPGERSATPEPAREAVEADVSTRTIAVTSAFTGTEIVVFGSVVNSRQPSAEAGYYDVIVVLEGMPTPLLARRKTNVAGLWVNTESVAFESAPSFYAIASTRPIEEIADATLLQRNAIGHDFARLSPAAHSAIETEPGELKAYKDAVIRLKQKDGLFVKRDYAVIFIGKSLFRSSIALPANVPVGPLTARVFLFREGELLSTFQSKVRLERSGIELWLYRAAMRHPFYYGLAAVLAAALAGLLASMPFRRKPAAA